jgi:hypothetical protein
MLYLQLIVFFLEQGRELYLKDALMKIDLVVFSSDQIIINIAI